MLIDHTINEISIFRINHSRSMPQTWLTECIILRLNSANQCIIKYVLDHYPQEETAIALGKTISFFKDFYSQLRLFPFIKRKVIDNIVNIINSLIQKEDKEDLIINGDMKKWKDLEVVNIGKEMGMKSSNNDNSELFYDLNISLTNNKIKHLSKLLTELSLNSFIDIEIEKELVKRNIPLFTEKDLSVSSNV